MSKFFQSNNLAVPYRHLNMLSRDKNYFLPEHDHLFFQIIWVTKGVLHVVHKGTEHRLRRGQLCIIPPGQRHSLMSEGGYEQLGIDLNEKHDERGIVSMVEKQVKDFVVLDRSDMLSVIPDLGEKAGLFTVLAKLQIASLLDSVLLSSLQMLDSETSFRSQMLVLMHLHLSENLTLNEISSRLAVSTSTLERITNREFGCSVMGLYHQLKINKACSLIINSELSMKQIAESLGFFDQAHFSRFFKQKMKMTPVHFKKTNAL
ncbi:helix-turn-helix domain-containing protein [Paenibacillus mesophilus]|uniref:helix-turn-helix domain-containing protein n=1 Tax=Paenibacillus mesophilus TaxID=2582849 RepID=UPI00110F5F97|nr:AraC family transcriptional regulator [Paenibacillus mesophilus]TMV49966.1 helix-turn-helix domain-containing protein [Paenibacillus mesophilus]